MRMIPILAICLLGFHYPVTTPLLLALGVPTSAANFVIKGFIAVLFLVALLFGGGRQQGSQRYMVPLLIFFLVYSVRLLNDVLVLGIVGAQSPTYILAYFFGLTFLPAVAIMVSINRSDLERLHHWLFLSIVLANLGLLFYLGAYGLPSNQQVFAGRAEVEGDLAGTAIINPIIVGLMGAVLVAFALGRLAVVRPIGGFLHLVHLGLILIGGFNVLIGASRGPALALILCFLILFYTMLRGSVGADRLNPRASIWVYGGAVVAVLVYLVAVQGMSVFLFDRFATMFDTSAGRFVEERDFVYAIAWNDFLDSPIYGASYLVSAGNQLAHNFVLDALMSTGVLGGLFLALAMLWFVTGIVNMIHGKTGPYGYSIALASVCFLVVGATSGSVGQFPELWLFLSLATVLGNHSTAARAAAPKAFAD